MSKLYRSALCILTQTDKHSENRRGKYLQQLKISAVVWMCSWSLTEEHKELRDPQNKMLGGERAFQVLKPQPGPDVAARICLLTDSCHLTFTSRLLVWSVLSLSASAALNKMIFDGSFLQQSPSRRFWCHIVIVDAPSRCWPAGSVCVGEKITD